MRTSFCSSRMQLGDVPCRLSDIPLSLDWRGAPEKGRLWKNFGRIFAAHDMILDDSTRINLVLQSKGLHRGAWISPFLTRPCTELFCFSPLCLALGCLYNLLADNLPSSFLICHEIWTPRWRVPLINGNYEMECICKTFPIWSLKGKNMLKTSAERCCW